MCIKNEHVGSILSHPTNEHMYYENEHAKEKETTSDVAIETLSNTNNESMQDEVIGLDSVIEVCDVKMCESLTCESCTICEEMESAIKGNEHELNLNQVKPMLDSPTNEPLSVEHKYFCEKVVVCEDIDAPCVIPLTLDENECMDVENKDAYIDIAKVGNNEHNLFEHSSLTCQVDVLVIDSILTQEKGLANCGCDIFQKCFFDIGLIA